MSRIVRKKASLSETNKESKDWPTGIMLLDALALMGTVATGAALGMLLGRKLILPSFIVAMYAIKKRNIYLLTSSVGTIVTARWQPKEADELKTAARDIKELVVNSFRGTKGSATNGLHGNKVTGFMNPL